MKYIILFTLLTICNFLFSQGAASCACVWSDAQGNLNCSVGNCGGANWTSCYNRVSTPNLWTSGQCPDPPTTNCNPYTWNTSLNGSCWYQGAGCSGTVVCQYVTALPVELVKFEASNYDGVNIISWTTASEINSSHFILSHTRDGETFEFSVILPAAFNSTKIINYHVDHSDYPSIINYYILEQVDVNGDVKRYGPISIDNREKEQMVINTVNVLGQIVDKNYEGLVIKMFLDGSSEMHFQTRE